MYSWFRRMCARRCSSYSVSVVSPSGCGAAAAGGAAGAAAAPFLPRGGMAAARERRRAQGCACQRGRRDRLIRAARTARALVTAVPPAMRPCAALTWQAGSAFTRSGPPGCAHQSQGVGVALRCVPDARVLARHSAAFAAAPNDARLTRSAGRPRGGSLRWGAVAACRARRAWVTSPGRRHALCWRRRQRSARSRSSAARSAAPLPPRAPRWATCTTA